MADRHDRHQVAAGAPRAMRDTIKYHLLPMKAAGTRTFQQFEP
jgi:hypothetical protein